MQGVVAFPTTVVDHVEGHFALAFVDAVHRQDLAGVRDGCIQAGFDALVQKHRVEYLAGSRVEAEGDIGQAQRGVHVRVLGLELTDRLDRFDTVAAGFFLASGNGEGQRVDDDVLLA